LNNNDVLCITGTGTYNGSFNINGDNVVICIDENILFSSGNLANRSNTVINNYGEINMGNITLDGTLNNFGTLHVGSMNINGNGILNNQGDSMYVGAMVISGDATIIGNATIGGSLTVNGTGTLNIQDGILNVGGAFQNNGTVTAAGSSNCGGISVAGSTTNNGGANYGSDGSPLDFCDPDGTFDTQNGTVGGSVSSCSCPPANPLPIELIHFSAENKSSYNLLEWATATEINNSHFVIEKLISDVEFEPIAEILGAENSKELISYSFLDWEISNKTAYYRLKQVDFDGSYTYSRVVSIHRNSIEDIVIRYEKERNVLVINGFNQLKDFQIFDLSGKLINRKAEHNNNEMTISTEGFSGIYIAKYISTDGNTFTKKLLLNP
jgi:hypothetical protein